MTHEKIMERVHTNLYTLVGQAAQSITHHDLGWTSSELVKRVVRYIYSAAKDPELLSLNWEQVAKQIVEHTMGTYAAACQEKPWFWDLNLNQAFASAVWEISCSSGRQRASYQAVEDYVNTMFEAELDKILLTKALWEASERTFADESVRSKVYRALYNTYGPVLDECLVDSRPLGDLQKVQHFTKRWAEEAMQRAWNSVQDSERTLTEGNVSRLLQNLIAPFGDDHDFSCIPHQLYERIGRPPRTWGFIRTVVTQLFATWKQGGIASSRPAKRRKQNHEEVKQAFDPEEEADEAALPVGEADSIEADADMVDEVQEAAADAPAAERHPACTSQDDCLGSVSENLVQHMLEGDAGDSYCETCWRNFLDNNNALEGTWLDGEKAGQKFSLSDA